MRNLIMAGLLICSGHIFAQTPIEKKFAVRAGQTLKMNFEDPKLIKVHTWDKQEVLIKGTVSINRGEHDGAFEITADQKGDVLAITSLIKDRDNIPKRTIIHKGDQDYYFQTGDPNDPVIQKFFAEHGREYTYMSNGIIHEITLEIFVPRGMASSVEAKFGLVEVTDFEAPLTVNSTFGGVDATVVTGKTGELIARTHFGEILTNLETKFTPMDRSSGDHWTEIRTSPGTGPSYEFESKFGKVYLRKP
jgi:hypothetical protein